MSQHSDLIQLLCTAVAVVQGFRHLVLKLEMYSLYHLLLLTVRELVRHCLQVLGVSGCSVMRRNHTICGFLTFWSSAAAA